MKANKLALGLLAGVTTITGVSSLAYGAQVNEAGKASFGEGHRGYGAGMHISNEDRAQMQELFTTGTYADYVAHAEENDMPVMSEAQYARHADQRERHDTIHEALLDGDYTTWRSILGEDHIIDVTVDNFDLLVAVAQARASGDQDAMISARKSLEDAGIDHKRSAKRPGMPGRAWQEEMGVDWSAVGDMSQTEKEQVLERAMNQIKTRLGLD